jgi:hypothetical protein
MVKMVFNMRHSKQFDYRILLLIFLGVVAVFAFLQTDLSRPLKLFLTNNLGKTNPKKHKPFFDKDKQYYFVDSKRGNDANPGTQKKPWKTLDRAALARAKKRGTVIYFRAGKFSGTLDPQSNGLKNARLTFKAYPSEVVEINAANSIKPAIDLSGKCYINVDGFVIRNSASDGVALKSKYGQHHISVSNCRISKMEGSGVRIRYAKNILVANNRIFNTGQYGITDKDHSSNIIIAGNDISYPGIDCIYIASPGITIDNNYLHDNSKPVDVREHADGIQVFIDKRFYSGLRSNIIVSNNKIRLNVSNGNNSIQSNSMMLENAGGVRIFNNVVIGKNTSNVLDVKNCPNSQIFNNTLIDSKHQGIYVHQGSTGCSIFNNIAVGSAGQSLLVNADSTAGLKSDHNIFSTPVKWKKAIMPLEDFSAWTGLDKHSIHIGKQTTVFSDIGKENFRVLKTGPAVNGGYANLGGLIKYPKLDKAGNPRCIGGLIDIGAYECKHLK